MGHKQQRALVLVNGALHPLPGGNVQMVGRLVQNQQIDPLVHEHTQAQAGLFAAGQGSHGLEHVLAGEHKRPQPVSCRLYRQILFVEHGIQQCALRMVKMDGLRQIRPFHRRAEADSAPVYRLLPQKAAQKGGLAGAVVSQKGNAFAPLHQQLHLRKQGAPVIGFFQVSDIKHLVPEKIPLGKMRPHGLFRPGALRLCHALHAVLNGHGSAVEHPVIDAPALHALHRVSQLAQLGLLLLIVLQLQVEARLLFLQIKGIISVVQFRFAAVDLNDAVYHLIEKIPVVGDGQNRALKLADIGLKPFHAVHIQMVGGLVQQ